RSPASPPASRPAGSSDGTVRLWDAATGTEVACLEAGIDGGYVSKYVAFHPGGTLLAVGGFSRMKAIGW
ncbi:MAG: hypothetical protein Q6373_016780, partial [Candidatus Sigynarchaeota archaeon]